MTSNLSRGKGSKHFAWRFSERSQTCWVEAKRWENAFCSMQVSIRIAFFFMLFCPFSVFFKNNRWFLIFYRGGICIWAASYPGNPASVRSGASPFVGSISKGSGMRWTLVDFLKSNSDEHISALSWSPDGRYPYLFMPFCFTFSFAPCFPWHNGVQLYCIHGVKNGVYMVSSWWCQKVVTVPAIYTWMKCLFQNQNSSYVIYLRDFFRTCL